MLSPVLDCGAYGNARDLVDAAFLLFQEKLMNPEKREKYFGKTVYVDARNLVDDKLDIFWHVIGLSPHEKFDVYPCANDPAQLICGNNCITRNWEVQTQDQKKAICIYRAIRAHRINEILKLGNDSDPTTKAWDEDDRYFLRYQNGLEDYVLILEKMTRYPGSLKLITAYPVFYIRQKAVFDAAYARHIARQMKRMEELTRRRAK